MAHLAREPMSGIYNIMYKINLHLYPLKLIGEQTGSLDFKYNNCWEDKPFVKMSAIWEPVEI